LLQARSQNNCVCANNKLRRPKKKRETMAATSPWCLLGSPLCGGCERQLVRLWFVLCRRVCLFACLLVVGVSAGGRRRCASPLRARVWWCAAAGVFPPVVAANFFATHFITGNCCHIRGELHSTYSPFDAYHIRGVHR